MLDMGQSQDKSWDTAIGNQHRHIHIVQDQVGLPQVPPLGHADALETQD